MNGRDRPLAAATDLVLLRGDHLAVDRSSFTIPGGALTAIIGPNGSGKSTLLHAVAGLITPARGTLELVGPDGGAPRISYVLQRVDLPVGVPLSVRETVGMGRYGSLGWWRRFRGEDRERVAWAMAELDVTHLARRHLTELSGGQRQRVHVAQGIAQDHDVLLLDEPLTGLDLVSAQTIDHIVHAERHAVILTTHDLDEARAADHVILMSGRVVASGPPAEVLTRGNLEVAYRLGALHEGADLFVDDPGGHLAPD